MTSLDMLISIERRILSPEFYRRDFRNMKGAADFLEVPAAELAQLLYGEYETSLRGFLLSMRLEDVREHLSRINPREPLHRLAAKYGFRSTLHLWWSFFCQEKCTPHRWVQRMGCLPAEREADTGMPVFYYVFAASAILNVILLIFCACLAVRVLYQ